MYNQIIASISGFAFLALLTLVAFVWRHANSEEVLMCVLMALGFGFASPAFEEFHLGYLVVYWLCIACTLLAFILTITGAFL